MGRVSPSARVRARKQAIAAVGERARFAREQAEPVVEEAAPSAADLGMVAPAEEDEAVDGTTRS